MRNTINYSKLQKHSSRGVQCKPQACNFIKKEILAQVFSCEFFILRTSFSIEHFWWLLLNIRKKKVMEVRRYFHVFAT